VSGENVENREEPAEIRQSLWNSVKSRDALVCLRRARWRTAVIYQLDQSGGRQLP